MASAKEINLAPAPHSDVESNGHSTLEIPEKSDKNDQQNDQKNIVISSKQSLTLVYASAVLDGCDEQLLPSTFRALEADLGFHPSRLGCIALSQGLCSSLLCPVWGYLADRQSRKRLLVFGTTGWGIITCLLGIVSEFWLIALLRGLNGIFLGCLSPISQSIIADTAPPKRLGFYFGLFKLFSCIGRLVGGVVVTSIAMTYIGTIRGWRLSFWIVGIASILLGIIIALLIEEIPRKRLQNKRKSDTSESQTCLPFLFDVIRHSLLTPSVILILMEGLVGTVSMTAFTFNTMFFQYCNMSNFQAGMLTGSFLIGAASGGVLGSLCSDFLAQWSPKHGRPLVGQLSLLCRIPLLLGAYVIVPQNQQYFPAFLALAILIGFTCIGGVAVNRPVLAEVVNPHHKATVFSINIALEGALGTVVGAPLVGYLAEAFFGYKKSTLLVSDMPDELRSGNATALSISLVILTVIPWTICFLIYGLLHFTYGKDKENVARIIQNQNSHQTASNAAEGNSVIVPQTISLQRLPTTSQELSSVIPSAR